MDELSVVVGDNSAHEQHLAGYNGIWHLSSVHDDRPLFLPPYCGMNFEYISPITAGNYTEPKDFPVALLVDEPGVAVTLHQQPTPSHKVESWMSYRVAGPCHLDWTFRYKLHDPGLFATGHAGFFFASYIDKPENKSLYVLSRDVYDTLMWVQFCTLYHGRNSAVCWESDPYDLQFNDQDHGLYASPAPIRYHVPLMLGRRGDMALAVMFEQPQGVALCHGMGGGGFFDDRSDRHPAWDFFLYARDPHKNLTGEWRGRLVYKKFVDRQDILDEYGQYQTSLGHDWVAPVVGVTKRDVEN
jgi:hypothetical protein